MPDIRYKVVMDDLDARKRLQNLHKISAEGSREFAKLFESITKNSKVDSSFTELAKAAKSASSGVSDLNKVKLESANIDKQQRQAKLNEIQDIGNRRRQIMAEKEEQARLTTEIAKSHLQSQQYKEVVNQLKIAEQQLTAQLKQGAIDTQKYALEQRRLQDAQKNAVAAQKEVDRRAREHVKLLNDQLRLQRQQEAQTERNKRKLQQESSEYYKLNQALNAVRRRAKDVLAEMFNLERQGQKNSAAYKMLEQRSKALVSQTQLLDQGIKKIDATLGLHQRNVGNYGSALDAISPTFARINSQLAMMGVNLTELAGKRNGFRELGASIATMGKNIGAFLLSPLGLAITAIASFFALIKGNARTVVQFNSGLLNVGKTTGLAGAELNKLGDSLVEMSRKLQVVSVDKLLEYATVAGQLGVKGSQNILKFSEALAKLETASNIQGEEGGSEIARLLTLVDGGVQNVSDFGDEIVNLGNNFAATEKEILSNATAIAQNVGLYKIGRREVLAYATATKAVGVEAELVGSTFNRTLGIFENSIRTGKNLSTILQVTGKSAEELKKQFKENASGVFNDFIRGLNQIDKSGGSVNQALNNIGITAVRDTRVIASLATNGYKVLTEALETATNAAGAMDKEFETAAGKLEKVWDRMGVAWDNLVLSIENGTGAIGKAAVVISDTFVTILEGITNVVTSKSWKEFWDAVNPTNWGNVGNIRELKRTFEEVSNFNNSIRNIGSGTDTWLENHFKNIKGPDFDKYLKEAEEYYKNIEKASTSYEAAVKAGRLKEGEITIASYKKEEEFAKKHYERLSRIKAGRGEDNANTTDPIVISEEESAKAKRAREAAQRRAEEALKRQRDLQAKIDEINKKASRQQLTKDEEEIQSIKDKYAEIQRVVDGFYKDSRNKGLKVDISGLAASQKLEIDEAKAKQELEMEKQIIQQKKVLFDQYEEYKKQVGKEKANEAFKEDLQGFESYIDYLRSLLPDESDTSVSANKKRDYFNKAIPAVQKEQDKRDAELYRKSLVEAQTFADKIRAIQQRLEDDITRLKGKASEDQLNVLRRNAQEEISAVTSSAIKQEHQWDETFSVMGNLSRKAAKEWLKNAERRLDYERRTGKLTVKEYQQMANEIKQAINDIDYKDPFTGLFSKINDYRKAIKEFGKGSSQANLSFREMAGVAAETFAAVGEITGTVAEGLEKIGIGSEGLQEVLGNVQELAGGLSELSKGIADKNPVGIITGAVKTLTSVISIFNTKDKKLQKQIEGYERALKSLQNTYSQLEKGIENSVGETYYKDSAAAVANLEAQIKNMEAARDAESQKKKKDQGVIDNYNQGIEDAKNQIEELNKAISEELLQTNYKQLSDNLADALLSAFEAGEDGIDALNKSFDQFIKNALVNSLKLKMIEPLIKNLTDDLTEYMLDNDNSLVGFNFEKWRDQLGEAGEGFMSALEQAFAGLGLDKENLESGGEGLAGTIGRSITEDTANKWMGVQLNMYTIAKNHFSEAQIQTKLMQSYMGIAQRNLDAALGTERNTAATVDRLDTAIIELRNIVNNTKQGKAGRDLA